MMQMIRTPVGWMKRLVSITSGLYVAAVLGLALLHALVPQRQGLLAVSEIFAPYLFLPALLVCPLALLRGSGLMRAALLVCVAVFALRYLPPLHAAPSSPGDRPIRAMTWNVYVGGYPDAIRPVLLGQPADLIALQETHTAWITQDPALAQLYPYRQVLPPWDAGGVSGMILLSTNPILEQGVVDRPADLWPRPDVMWARVDLGGGQQLVVITAHPRPAAWGRGPCLLPLCYDPTRRDAQLASIHALVAPWVAAGERVLLLGDFNISEREPAYRDLAAGLRDAYLAAGAGAGATWGPGNWAGKGLPLLRIDYLFTSPNVTPLGTTTDCTFRGSDHCILRGTFALK